MLQRTWQYGQRADGEIFNVTHRLTFRDPLTPLLTMVKTVDGEGHILSGITHAIEPVEHMRVILEFTQGGPTGGFWKIVEAARLWTARLKSLTTADGLCTIIAEKADVGKIYTVDLDSTRRVRMLNIVANKEHEKEIIDVWDEGNKAWRWFATELLEYEQR